LSSLTTEILYACRQALTQKVVGRLDDVKENVQYGRHRILDEAASDLYEMYAQRSVQVQFVLMADGKAILDLARVTSTTLLTLRQNMGLAVAR
jgi:hypothetical protein